MAKRSRPEATSEKLRNARFYEFHISPLGTAFDGLTYHTCRFCGVGLGDVNGLFKYSVRHYACAKCRLAIVVGGKQ